MRHLFAPLLLLACTGPAFAEVPFVVASVKPIHSLVSAVMGDVGSPELIVDGAASPHTYSLRPSDAGALGKADIVFWTGGGFELFLTGSIGTLAPQARVVALSENPAITLLPIREGGPFEAHADEAHAGEDHGHDHAAAAPEPHAHDHEDEHDHAPAGVFQSDMHFWLDPVNAIAMVGQIAETLTEVDPGHASVYAENARAEVARLTALTADIDARLAPVRDIPFIVFHDALQYFESRFGLTVAGSITVTPDTLPGAQRILALRDKVRAAGAVCVFAEPQFEPAVVTTIIGGTPTRSGTLDPEGAGLEPGPDLYAKLVTRIADSIRTCLEG